MRAFLVGLLVLPLAGCTQLGDAATDAQVKLDEARREAQEAQDRYDRIRSTTVVRNETVALTVQPVLDGASLGFSVVSARRSDLTLIPPMNITRLPLLGLVDDDGDSFACDPLSCRISLPENGTLIASWMDRPTEKTTLRWGSLPVLHLAEARITATTAAADISQ